MYRITCRAPQAQAASHRPGRASSLAAIAALVATLTLGACAEVPPTAAPTVTERSPSPGAGNVWIGDPITVRFSEAMATDSGAPATLTTSTGAEVAVEWGWSSDARTLTGRVSEAPAVPAELTLALAPTLASASGRPLAPPDDAHTWSVPAWQRLGAALNVDAERSAVDPSIVVAPDGSILVGWHEASEGFEQDVLVARWSPDAGTWERLGGALDAVPTNDASNVSLTMDVEGRQVAAWQERDLTENLTNVRAARWDAATAAWTPLGGPLVLEESTRSFDPSLALRPDGSLVVANVERALDGDVVMAWRWDEGAQAWSWIVPGVNRKPPSPGPHGVARPSLAFDANGRVIVARHETVPGQLPRVFVDRRSNASLGQWTSLLSTEGGVRAQDASLAVGPDDVPVVAWRQVLPGAVWQVVAYRSVPGTDEWEALGGEPLNVDPANPAGEPWLAIDQQSRPVVAWHENADGNRDVHVRRWDPAGAAWQPLGGVLDADPARNAFQPRLAIDLDGRPVAAWHESVDGVYQVFAARWNGR